MKTRELTIGILLAGLSALGIARHASASAIAFDSTAQSAYNDGWQGGDNGGSGWGGAWVLSTTSGDGNQNGFFQYLSASNGGGAGPGIDVNGKSWGMYANSGQTASAVRSFSGALSIGQTVRVSYDNGWIDNGGKVGIDLQTSSGANRFEFYYLGGDGTDSYKYVDSTGQQNVNPNIGFSEGGFTLAFTLTGTDTYDFTITRLSDNAFREFTGTLEGAGDITQLRLFNANAGGGGERNAYFNSISVPEPTMMGLMLLAGLPLFSRRRVTK